jgi:prevent-host-death family protein
LRSPSRADFDNGDSKKTIPQRSLRNDSSELLPEAEADERFVLTVNGRPVAALGPYERRRAGLWRGEWHLVPSGDQAGWLPSPMSQRPPSRAGKGVPRRGSRRDLRYSFGETL